MSYNAISKMDTIGNVFTHINNMTTKYNESYSDSETKAVYKVINLHPQFYYN
jgi:ribosomal protein S8